MNSSESRTVAPESAEKPEIERITVLVSAGMRERLETMAEREKRSLSAQVNYLVERGIEAQERAAA